MEIETASPAGDRGGCGVASRRCSARRRRHGVRRARRGEDDLRPRRLPGARRHRAGHEPDLHDRPPLRGPRAGLASRPVPLHVGVARRSGATSSRTSSDAIAFVEWPEAAGGRAAVAARARSRLRHRRPGAETDRARRRGEIPARSACSDADPRVRHGDRRRDERARRRRRGARRARRRAPSRVLEDVDALLRAGRCAPARPRRRSSSASGPAASPASRIGLAAARGLALALGFPVAGVSTLDALAAGAPGALPVIDAKRRRGVRRCRRRAVGRARRPSSRSSPGRCASATVPSATASVLEARGADVPPDDERAASPARPLPRARSRATSARPSCRAALPARAGRATGWPRSSSSCAGSSSRDLDAIERIERRSYPTPWSRSMFASELAKPTLDLPRRVRAETASLVGYLILSRYVDAWHVMNVAVAGLPPARHRPPMLDRLFELTAADGGAATRSRSASRTSTRSGSTNGSASRPAGSGAATTRTTARTR